MSRGPTMVAESRACVGSNRALLDSTRYLIASSRRKLNPYFAVSGGAAPPLRETVRALLASGILCPPGRRVVAVHGARQRCVICHEPLVPHEVAYEVEGGESGWVRCHFSCFLVWKEESVGVPGASPRNSPVQEGPSYAV